MKDLEIGQPINSGQRSETADGVARESEGEPGYRFYALYDKISREDILAHAYAQCRSNKGAPGVDRQDFEAVEAYGVERWLGELALALRQETYRPDPIRRVYIPKANGKLRPLGISTLRDRVCMTVAMLVLEPIFEADLPPELYAYRPGRNAQQAVVAAEIDSEHTDTGRTERRHVVAMKIIHIGKEANKWEEQFFLGEDEDAGIEYEAGAAHQAINANVRRLVRELGERSAADELTISRTALRKILVEGAGSSSRVTLRKIAQRQFTSSLVERTVGK